MSPCTLNIEVLGAKRAASLSPPSLTHHLIVYGKAEYPDSQLPGVQFAGARDGRNSPRVR